MSSAPVQDDAPVQGRDGRDHDRSSGALEPPRPSRPDPLLGQTLAGKYEVIELLGEGAMGRVYRARQIVLDKEIALKVLHRHLTGAERIELRFHREARAASRLSHPNSVHIHDFGTAEDGTLYIAMELLDGEDLQTILDHDHPLSPARIAMLLVPVLRALEEAHRAGIIHRDLKPENVVVQPDRSGREHVKVCDFGIAKILDHEEGQSLTVDGFVCGTPQYMAPEQGRGDAIDHRCDIYAAGVVLYQMLCGVVPFSGENALGVLTRQVVEAPVPPRRRRPDLGIPPSLERLCLRALEKDPGERWQTAGEMADALEASVRTLGASADVRLGEGPFRGEVEPRIPSSPPRRLPRLVALGSLLLVAASALAVGLGREEPSDATPRPAAPVESPMTPPSPPLPPERSEGDPANLAASAEAPPAPAPTPAAARPRARRERAVITSGGGAGASSPRDEPPAPSPGDLAFDEGRRRFLANDVPGAIERFEEAARLTPRRAETHKQLGRAYMRAGQVSRSIAAYRRYLELAPDAADRAVVERIIAQHSGG